MRLILSAMAIGMLFGAEPALAELPGDMFTTSDAILCLSRENVGTANQPAVSRSQIVLSAMGCLRPEPGVRIRMLERGDSAGPVQVRFYPGGISMGIVLWALPSSFTDAERARLLPAANRHARNRS